MRTTLTLEDDVAALLRRLQKEEELSLKELVNRGLREGLPRLSVAAEPRARYVTGGRDLGTCLVGNLDDLSEVLAVAEGEDFK